MIKLSKVMKVFNFEKVPSVFVLTPCKLSYGATAAANGVSVTPIEVVSSCSSNITLPHKFSGSSIQKLVYIMMIFHIKFQNHQHSGAKSKRI